MRILKIVLALVICGVVVFSASCASGSGSTPEATSSVATVKKGNITLDVTATGNLSLSHTEDLAFEIAGTVEEVLVSAGDSVTEGQELVKLDTSEWDTQLKTVEKALVTAQRSLTTMESTLNKAERNVTTREGDVTNAERQITAKELAVRQAQLDLKTAEGNLDQIAEVKAAQDAVDEAEYSLKLARSISTGDWAGTLTIGDPIYWNQQVVYFEQRLAQAQTNLQEILNGSSTKVSGDVALQVTKSQLQLEQSQWQLEGTQIAVEDARSAVDDARLAVEDARQAFKDAQLNKADAEQAVKDAQSDLDEAKGLSPIIIAPFAGFVTKTSISGGEEVKKGTIALQIADPTRFEVGILVSEQDISSITVGRDAAVLVDALSVSLPAKVTYIAPTATISQGVVNFNVTVELQSLQPSQPTMSGRQSQSGQSQSTPPAGFTPPARTQLPDQQGTSGQSSTPSAGTQPSVAPTQTISVKQGLSATVTVTILQKNDVLLVPNRAITRQGRNSAVQVIKDGVTESRTITIGASDLQNTEVISGLSEGEQVVLPAATSSASSSTQRQGGMMFPIGGGR